MIKGIITIGENPIINMKEKMGLIEILKLILKMLKDKRDHNKMMIDQKEGWNQVRNLTYMIQMLQEIDKGEIEMIR